MAQNKFLSFLNSLDRGASDRNSITEFLANILTPGDNMEYVGGQLLGADGKRPENFGERTRYGTLGQANFEGNDRIKRGLLSKMTSGMSDMNNINATPPGYGSRRVNMRPDALDMLSTSRPDEIIYDYPEYPPSGVLATQSVMPNNPMPGYGTTPLTIDANPPGYGAMPNNPMPGFGTTPLTIDANPPGYGTEAPAMESDIGFNRFYEKIKSDVYYLPIVKAMTEGREGSEREALKFFYDNTDPQVLAELGLM